MAILLLFLLHFTASCAYGQLGYQWTKIPGTYSQVYGNIEIVWGINAHHQVYYCVRPCTGNWVHDTSSVSNLDVGIVLTWVISHDSYAYYKSSDSSNSWIKRTEIPTAMIDIAASGNLYVWFLTNTRELYRWRHINSAVVKFPGLGKFDQIDANVDYLFALNATSHAINYRKVDGKGEWRIIPGKMKYVTVGIHDIFAIGVDDKLYRCTIPCAGVWELMGSPSMGVVQIDATTDALFAVTTGGDIYRHELPL